MTYKFPSRKRRPTAWREGADRKTTLSLSVIKICNLLVGDYFQFTADTTVTFL